VQLAAPATLGSLQSSTGKWMAWIRPSATGFPTVTMSANHTVTAVYSVANDVCSGAVTLSAGVPYSMNTSNATSTSDLAPCAYNFR